MASVLGLITESSYELSLRFDWNNCEDQDSVAFSRDVQPRANSSNRSIYFTIKGGAHSPLDIKSINDICPDERQGFAFNITGTHHVTSGPARWNGGDTCGEVASFYPKPNPYRSKASPSTASSMSAALINSVCDSPRVPGMKAWCSEQREIRFH